MRFVALKALDEDETPKKVKHLVRGGCECMHALTYGRACVQKRMCIWL
jgi:hypothetical protein